MTKQLGRTMLLKVGDGGGTEAFTAMAGLTAKRLGINTASIDVTTPDATTPGGIMFQESLMGVTSMSLSGDGKFVDDAQEARLNTIALSNDNILNCEIVVPNFGTYAGAFRLESVEFAGDDALDFSISLVSSGAVTFTAA